MTIQRKITLVDMTSREKKKHGNTPRLFRVPHTTVVLVPAPGTTQHSTVDVGLKRNTERVREEEWWLLNCLFALFFICPVKDYRTKYFCYQAKFFQRFFQEKSNLRGYTEIGMKKCKPRKCN